MPPITDAKKTVELCKITLPTANKSLHHLADFGIVKEITGKPRNKVYVYQKYLDILSEEYRNDFIEVKKRGNNVYFKGCLSLWEY